MKISKTPLLLSLAIGLVVAFASCSKQDVESQVIQQENEDKIAQEGFNYQITQLSVDKEIDDSFYDRALTKADLAKLDMGLDPGILDHLQVSMSKESSASRTLTGSCGASDARSSAKGEQGCCNTNITTCYTGHNFRADGCFEWIFEVTQVNFVMSFFVDNAYVGLIGTQMGHLIERGCNFYEPHAVINANTGQVVSYICFGPSPFNPNCPAKIRVETQWRYVQPNNTLGVCGFNSKSVNWPGNPQLCPSEF